MGDRLYLTMLNAPVRACARHRWRWEDLTPPGVESIRRKDLADWYMCEICADCGGIRCDARNHADERCKEARHHQTPHAFRSGGRIEVGA